MPNLTASVPHQLTRAEAKRRIQEGVSDFHRQQPALLGGVHETWNGDTMNFSGGVMGQSISGWINVEDREVRVEVVLPGLLGMMAAALKPQIERQGQKLLGGPPSGPRFC